MFTIDITNRGLVKRLDRIDEGLWSLRKFIDQGNQKLMSQITDWAAQEEADLSAISTTLDNVVSGIAALDALITAFQNSPGTLTPQDQAALDAIQASAHALVTKASAISTAPPVPPAV